MKLWTGVLAAAVLSAGLAGCETYGYDYGYYNPYGRAYYGDRAYRSDYYRGDRYYDRRYHDRRYYGGRYGYPDRRYYHRRSPGYWW
jgi:hypothetical protein